MILFVFELAKKDVRPPLRWALWATIKEFVPTEDFAERTVKKWLDKAFEACQPPSEDPKNSVEDDFWDSGNV